MTRSDQPDRTADERQQAADERDRTADERQQAADERDRTADERQQAADRREAQLDERESLLDERTRHLRDRAPSLLASVEETVRQASEMVERSRAHLGRLRAAQRRDDERSRREQAEVDRESRPAEPPPPG